MHLSQHWTVKLRTWELILAFEMELIVNKGTVSLRCVLVFVAFQGILSVLSGELLEKMLLVTKCAIPWLYRRTCPSLSR